MVLSGSPEKAKEFSEDTTDREESVDIVVSGKGIAHAIFAIWNRLADGIHLAHDLSLQV
jgi:hypothetical protein